MAAINRLLRSAAAAARSPAVSFSSMSSSSKDYMFPASMAHKAAAATAAVRRDPLERNVQWVFLGCPGVGKGTYASRLSSLIGVPHIATGDIVRDEIRSSGPLSKQEVMVPVLIAGIPFPVCSTHNMPYGGVLQLAEIVNQGKLVSDEIIINLLSKRLEEGVAKGESGFILDGFPRTVRQAEILDGVTDIDLVVNLKIREDVLLEKCLGRRICSQCGGNFNIASINVKGEDGRPAMSMAPLLPPAHCASKLITRSDDNEEVVKERLRIYRELSQPVEEFYRNGGKLLEFELPGGIQETWPKLLYALNLDDHEDKQSAAA